ncbi:hypothetical protein QJS10_CPB20g01314 [Acorus calamus]|uniref:DUF4220 domain-containing protein n=1 Tax=Acorus calamus TaxID=4465 RepID=A0AAV9C9I5_ACOCL|nr:hypothetical protein QJS10_CPB20g01314 [Acorus calamus]
MSRHEWGGEGCGGCPGGGSRHSEVFGANLGAKVCERRQPEEFYGQPSRPMVEFELSFIYQMLYTKAPVVYSNIIGPILRAVTISLMSISLILFIFTKKSGYREMDIIITYTLFMGGLLLETWAITLLLSSDQALLWLKNPERFRPAAKLASPCIEFLHTCWRNNLKWSEKMAQCNLINICLAKERCWLIAFIENHDLLKESSSHTNGTPSMTN